MTRENCANTTGEEESAKLRAAPGGGPTPTAKDAHGLSWSAWLSVALTALIITAFTLPCLPPTICRGDFGDLQLAAWTLGIAHPPGYPLITVLLHPFTWVPGLEPAYAVSLGSMVISVAALLICVLMQIRLGVHAWIAGAMVIGLSLYQRVQLTLVGPEVYGATLLFLALSAYLALRFVQAEKRWALWGSAFCYGIALISRPPLVLTAPFVFLALRSAAQRAPLLGRVRTWLVLAGFAAIPAALSLAYILIRDQADLAYNYIEDFNIERGTLPHPHAGVAARLQRAYWLMSGQQFNEYVGIPLRDVQKKIGWLRREIVPQSLVGFLGAVLISGAGGVCVWRQSRVAALLLSGMVVQCVVYALTYRVHGQAADLLPLLFAMAVFVGASLSWLVVRLRKRVGNAIAATLFSGLGVLLFIEPHLCNPDFLDGGPLTAEVDMATMPRGAVIVTEWDPAAPLRYARLLTDRRDVTVLTVHPTNWKNVPGRYPDRTVYTTHLLEELKADYEMMPFRNLYRLSVRVK